MTYTAKVLQSVQETPDVKTIIIERPKEFKFTSGQFVMISTGYRDEKKLLIKRSYSIASEPNKTEYLEFCVKKKQAPSFSAALHELKQEDTLFIEGPFGKFVLKEPLKENTIFIAGGAGIAPIRSMIKTAIAKELQHKIALFYSFHFPEDYIYKTELEELAKKEKKIEIFASMSAKDKEFSEWSGLRGRVTEHLPKHIEQRKEYTIYICGPPPMVADTVKQLISLGVKEENINKEAW